MKLHSNEDAIGKCDDEENLRTAAVSESPHPKRDGNSVLLDGSQNLYPYLVVDNFFCWNNDVDELKNI